MNKKSVGRAFTFLALLGLSQNPANAELIPNFEEKLPVGSYAHVAAVGDASPDKSKWSSIEYLSGLDEQIDKQGFAATTGLAWSKNLNDNIAMSPDAHSTLVVFEFNVDTPTNTLMELSAAHGFAWYYRDHNGEVHHHIDNYSKGIASREVFDIRPVIPLRFEPNHTYRVFVVTFVYSPGSIVSYNLWQPESFRANRTAFHLTEGMFFGFAITIAIASLVFAIAFQQIVYLFFAGFIASSSITIYSSTGFSLLFGLGDQIKLTIPLITLSYGATTAFANLFGMYFLDMWNTHRKLYWTYFGMTIFTTTVSTYPLFMSATTDSVELVYPSTGIAMLVGQLVHLYTLVYYLKKNQSVIYWWTGMTVYSGSILFSVIRAGESTELGNVPQLTMVVDALLLMILLIFNFKGEQASRRAAQQSSIENLRLARDLEKSRSTFVAAVGHDLRGPVQAISHFTESLKHSATEPHRQKLNKIDENILSISELLDSMINLSRIDWQSSQPQVEPVALRPLLLELRSAFLGKAAEKNLELEIETTECAVLTDRVCLGQILRNLTDNAIKYTDAGFIRVRVVTLETTVKITVADSGVGIPVEDFGNIFGEFYQVDRTDESKPGVGLGLSIVARLTRLLGIRITVNSKDKQGSQFELEIDRTDLPEHETPLSEAALSGMSNTTLALVSNEVAAFKNVVELLKSWGVKVVITDIIPAVTVDLVVIDQEALDRLRPDEEAPLVIIEPDISPMRLRRLVQRQINSVVK